MKLIDTHQHLWDLDRHEYSWTAGIPLLNRSFVMKDYLEAASKLPNEVTLDKAIFMEADVDENQIVEETRWAIALCEDKSNPTSGVIAACRPEHEDFCQIIEPLTASPYLKGLRRVLHTQPDDLSQQQRFVDNLKTLPKCNLTFDLCVLSRQLPLAIDLVRKTPTVSYILDHCGVPDIKGKALDPWRDYIRELSRMPNVVACKISGLVAYSGEEWKTDDLRPFIDHVIECFGWDRLVFGSDYPVCLLTADYSRWVTALLEIVGKASTSEKEKLFSENARRIYRIE